MNASNKKGLNFEKHVAHIYDKLGKINVEHNITYTTQGVKAQFDIVHGWIAKQYIECKYRSNEQPVTYEEVAVFSGKLRIIKARQGQGVMITNTNYTQRAKVFAKNVGVDLIDGEGLKDLEWESQGLVKRILTWYK
jgi:restriction endonuclease Mrr